MQDWQGGDDESNSICRCGALPVRLSKEAALTGVGAGEGKSFPVHFPADYAGKEVAGKTANFEVSVKKVEAPLLPEVNG